MKTAREILRAVPLIDGHNDLPWALRKASHEGLDAIALARDTTGLTPPLATDLTRLKAGGVGGQFWAAFVPCALRGPAAVLMLLEQIDRIHRLIGSYPDALELALTAEDIARIHGRGKIASLIGVEGGHAIGNSLAVLRMAHALGARYLTLTHVKNNDWADSATDQPAHQGLTPFGRQVVRELNRLGMLADLSHVSDQAMLAALDTSLAPVIFSHSGARALCPHPRNVPDDILGRVAANGGLVMVSFVPEYLTAPPGPDEQAHNKERAALPDVANHIDHIREVAGLEHVGIGSDFDGFSAPPAGLEDVSCYPALLAELLRRGYSGDDVKKVAGQNLLRVLRAAQETAARL
jgi:membrane dipeptidase